ncbi:MAG: trypsin-like peptidase domain-containing protein [Marmoricola sp.]
MTTPHEPVDPTGAPADRSDAEPTTEWYDGSTESTRPLPFVPSAGEGVEKPFLSRRGGVVAVIVAAVLAGGAAGVGGAVWANDWSDQNTSSTVIDPNAAASETAAGAGSSVTERVAAKVLPSVVQINVAGPNESGSGSGIVLSADGVILTNNHVVVIAAQGGSISVSMNNGKVYPAKLIGTDPVTDSAVIQAQGLSGLTPATLGHSTNLKVGQTVLAIGAPYGLSSTVTGGIISALNRPVQVDESGSNGNNFNPFAPQQQTPSLSTTYPAIQTDAAINPGNSGGALVDMTGNVVGMNSSIQTASSGSTGSVGLGFAIPIDELLPIINQIVHHQTPTHARLGVSVGNAAGNSSQQGALVASVDPKGVAKTAGLKTGDLITKVDNEVVTNGDSLVATIRGHRPQDKVTLTYIRNGKTETVDVVLGSDAASKNS